MGIARSVSVIIKSTTGQDIFASDQERFRDGYNDGCADMSFDWDSLISEGSRQAAILQQKKQEAMRIQNQLTELTATLASLKVKKVDDYSDRLDAINNKLFQAVKNLPSVRVYNVH